MSVSEELDVVLSRYLEMQYCDANAEEQAQFRALLEMPDPDLYNLLLGRGAAENPGQARLLRHLRISPGQS